MNVNPLNAIGRTARSVVQKDTAIAVAQLLKAGGYTVLGVWAGARATEHAEEAIGTLSTKFRHTFSEKATRLAVASDPEAATEVVEEEVIGTTR